MKQRVTITRTALSFGQVPVFEEFEQRFYASADVPHTGMYVINLSDADYRMMENCQIYPARMYDCESLHSLLLDLANAHNGLYWRSNKPSLEQRDWAGDHASSILFTLGYEWI
jgi:hypothetical protein